MKFVLSLYILEVLLAGARSGFLNQATVQNARQDGIPVLCKSLPLPSLEADAFLSKLQPYLDQVDQKVQAALKEENSTGGAVLSVVYKNVTIWTKGYGLIDMSSE